MITLVPAYGRDYKSKAAVELDWNEGKDFFNTFEGRYINREDAERIGVPSGVVRIRYCKTRKVVTIQVDRISD
jgi:hypothetical protein